MVVNRQSTHWRKDYAIGQAIRILGVHAALQVEGEYRRESCFVLDSRLVMNYVSVHLCLDESAILGCLERAASVEFSAVPVEAVEITKTVGRPSKSIVTTTSNVSHIKHHSI